MGAPIYPCALPCGKKKKEKIVSAGFRRTGNPLYPEVKIIKLNCCLSVKDVNTSGVSMFDQTNYQGAQCPDTDEDGQACSGLIRFWLKGLLSPPPPTLRPIFQLFFFTLRTAISLCSMPLPTLSAPHKRYTPFFPLFLDNPPFWVLMWTLAQRVKLFWVLVPLGCRTFYVC